MNNFHLKKTKEDFPEPSKPQIAITWPGSNIFFLYKELIHKTDNKIYIYVNLKLKKRSSKSSCLFFNLNDRSIFQVIIFNTLFISSKSLLVRSNLQFPCIQSYGYKNSIHLVLFYFSPILQ